MNDTFDAMYTIRHPTMDDAQGATDVINTAEIAISGTSDYSVDAIRDIWRNLDIEHDAYIAEIADGTTVGAMFVEQQSDALFGLEGYVHPAHLGRGIGTQFLRLAQERVREQVPNLPPDTRVTLRHGLQPENIPAVRLLEQHGWLAVRYFYRMAIDLDAPPDLIPWPDGITLSRFRSDADEQATFEALEDAFLDMWQRAPGRFEDFLTRTQASNFDPDLWLLAMDGDHIAGMALCSQQPERGYIHSVGVRRPWRGRSVGLALLRAAFRILYDRGERHIELSVDSESPTGATRLYRRAGMHTAFTITLYEYEIRAGRAPDEDTTI